VVQAGSSSGLSNLANFNTGGTATTFSAAGVGGGTYFIRVLAQNLGAQSAASNEVVVVVASPPNACSVLVSPTATAFAANGGDGLLTVTASAPDCVWTASVNVPFEESLAVRITSGASGQGNGQVTYHVDPNVFFGVTRTNHVVVSAAPSSQVRHVVTQQPATSGCTFTLASPSSLTFGPSGGTGQVTLNASAPTCGWAVDVSNSTEDWVRVGAPARVVGSGTATFTVQSASSTPFVPLPRSGSLVITDASGIRLGAITVSQQ
jgi:hypothetical protein